MRLAHTKKYRVKDGGEQLTVWAYSSPIHLQVLRNSFPRIKDWSLISASLNLVAPVLSEKQNEQRLAENKQYKWSKHRLIQLTRRIGINDVFCDCGMKLCLRFHEL